MSTSARRRLMRDFKVWAILSVLYANAWTDARNLVQRMQTDPPAGVSASPIADNVMTWYVVWLRTLKRQIY